MTPVKEIIVTAFICLLIGGAVFFSLRKLWRDRKNGKSCCGSCEGCPGCSADKKKT